MPDIIQFIHPGGQYQIDKHSNRYCWNKKYTKGIYFWNSGAHCRKFIRSNGDYVDKNDKFVGSEELLFWGEWEPCSHFQMLENSANNPFLPHHIHSPKYCLENQGTMNTDPLIFGTVFYYSNCNNKVQSLQLTPGSIILFGTNYLKPKKSTPCFVLDTVFIVKERIPYSVKNWKSGLDFKQGDILYDITLSKIQKGNYNLYTGENYSNNKKHFSFVPVKKYDQNSKKGFERAKFYLDAKKGKNYLKDIQSVRLGFAYFKRNESIKQCQKFWDLLVANIRKQGFELGVRFDNPPNAEKKSCCCDENPVSQNQEQKAKKVSGCSEKKVC